MNMNRMQRGIILAELLDNMDSQGSWCGETHLQKATYFLQELTGVPTGFPFILYKHGPFSFDLRDELTSLRADGLFGLKIRPEPYAPSYVTTSRVGDLKRGYEKTLTLYGEELEFVSAFVGSKGAAELERLGTALFVSRMGTSSPTATVEGRARRLNELKPHVSLEKAQEAVLAMDRKVEEARQIMSSGEHSKPK